MSFSQISDKYILGLLSGEYSLFVEDNPYLKEAK